MSIVKNLYQESLNYVYIIQAGNKVKIGSSADVGKRLKQLDRTHSGLKLLALIFGGRMMELALHKRFKADSANHEWFELSAEMQVFIDSVSQSEEILSSKLAEQRALMKLLKDLNSEIAHSLNVFEYGQFRSSTQPISIESLNVLFSNLADRRISF